MWLILKSAITHVNNRLLLLKVGLSSSKKIVLFSLMKAL